MQVILDGVRNKEVTQGNLEDTEKKKTDCLEPNIVKEIKT